MDQATGDRLFLDDWDEIYICGNREKHKERTSSKNQEACGNLSHVGKSARNAISTVA